MNTIKQKHHPRKIYFFSNILNFIVLPGRAKSKATGLKGKTRATIYQEMKKLPYSNENCDLHITRNRIFIKGDRNIKNPNDPKTHYSQGYQYFNDLEPGLEFNKPQLCRKG